MQIKVQLANGFLPEAYTKKANIRYKNQPILSFPIELTDIPKHSKSLAISLIDYDAVPRTGFPFIHWLALNIPIMTEIPADFSRNFEGPQGQTSWMSRFYALNEPYFTNHYAGPNPPEQPHNYALTVFALKQNIELPSGFYYNEFRNKLHGQTITDATINILAK